MTITPAQVAKAMGWTTRRARRRLLAAGAVERQGRRLVTTFAMLVERFPEAVSSMDQFRLPVGKPGLLEAADVANLLGWPTHRARRWMRRSGAAEKRGGRWVTTAAKLRELFSGDSDDMGDE